MKTLITLAALTLAAPAVARDKAPLPEPAEHPDWTQVRENAEAILKDELYDPDAARIVWTKGFVWTSWKQGDFGLLNKRRWGWLACGTINGKNLMGAYTGAKTVAVTVMPDGTMKAGMAYSIDSECSYDDTRRGPVIAQLK